MTSTVRLADDEAEVVRDLLDAIATDMVFRAVDRNRARRIRNAVDSSERLREEDVQLAIDLFCLLREHNTAPFEDLDADDSEDYANSGALEYATDLSERTVEAARCIELLERKLDDQSNKG